MAKEAVIIPIGYNGIPARGILLSYTVPAGKYLIVTSASNVTANTGLMSIRLSGKSEDLVQNTSCHLLRNMVLPSGTSITNNLGTDAFIVSGFLVDN